MNQYGDMLDTSSGLMTLLKIDPYFNTEELKLKIADFTEKFFRDINTGDMEPYKDIVSADSFMKMKNMVQFFQTLNQHQLIYEYLEMNDITLVSWQMVQDNEVMGVTLTVTAHMRNDAEKTTEEIEFPYLLKLIRPAGSKTVPVNLNGCPSCGAAVSDQFCIFCGSRLWHYSSPWKLDDFCLLRDATCKKSVCNTPVPVPDAKKERENWPVIQNSGGPVIFFSCIIFIIMSIFIFNDLPQ